MSSGSLSIEANIVDPLSRTIQYGTLRVSHGKIDKINYTSGEVPGRPYLMPGFIDAHIHIESSMLAPPAFAAIAIKHGTVATVSDPHEIANVCGLEGVRYMVEWGRKSGFKFHFGAPSCIPATPFETAGSSLTLSDIRELFESGETTYLAEMMNYPAVLAHDPLVMDKITLAQEYGLPIDGHAPGLKGKDAHQYAQAGITTDHECTTLEEALDKLEAGMKIIIREGSAAKNYNALHTLISLYPDQVMFCSDDKHPDDLLRGHINELVLRSIAHGYPLMDVLRIACVNPVRHYSLNVGLLQPGDPADMIMVDDLSSFHVSAAWIEGILAYDGHTCFFPVMNVPVINSFGITGIDPRDLGLYLEHKKAQVIGAIDGAIVTDHNVFEMEQGNFESDINRDILKIAVINRYHAAPPSVALIHGFGLTRGAIASSVAHDSHNIVAVGVSDAELAACINELISQKGGVCAVLDDKVISLPLPIGGLMSTENAEKVGEHYEKIDLFVKNNLGSILTAPFMTLSFMALLVIPALKMSDLGLFDGKKFQMTSLQ
jgi:adenine deaminase